MRNLEERPSAETPSRVDRTGLAISKLADGPRPTAGQIDAFLKEHSFPIVEGRRCTVVYRGPAQLHSPRR